MAKNDNLSGADAGENGSGKKSEDGTEVPKGPAKGHEKDAHNSHGASKQNAGTGGHKG